MRYILMQVGHVTLITQAEDDPDKVVDCILDEYSKEPDPEKRVKIMAVLQKHIDSPTIFLNKNYKPIPYDPNLHSNLVRDGAIIGKKLL